MPRRVGIIGYGLGNVGSIRNMLRKIGVLSEIISTPEDLARVDRAILPGIGNFGHGMTLLRDGGWIDAIHSLVRERRRPLLGICLGMQLLSDGSAEGEGDGLGLIRGKVHYFDTNRMRSGLPLPHMGWTEVPPPPQSKLMRGLAQDARFYFVHSLHLVPEADAGTLQIEANYGYDFTCAVERGNVFGVQFHPEKSHVFGMGLLRNFCDIAC